MSLCGKMKYHTCGHVFWVVSRWEDEKTVRVYFDANPDTIDNGNYDGVEYGQVTHCPTCNKELTDDDLGISLGFPTPGQAVTDEKSKSSS